MPNYHETVSGKGEYLDATRLKKLERLLENECRHVEKGEYTFTEGFQAKVIFVFFDDRDYGDGHGMIDAETGQLIFQGGEPYSLETAKKIDRRIRYLFSTIKKKGKTTVLDQTEYLQQLANLPGDKQPMATKFEKTPTHIYMTPMDDCSLAGDKKKSVIFSKIYPAISVCINTPNIGEIFFLRALQEQFGFGDGQIEKIRNTEPGETILFWSPHRRKEIEALGINVDRREKRRIQLV